MIGHQGVIAMRRSGMKPAFVWLSDFPDCMLAERLEDHQTVRVHGDMPELLDLRFLVGTTVIIEGPDESRVQRLAKVCEPLAHRIIATVVDASDKFHPEPASISDSKGDLTWPK